MGISRRRTKASGGNLPKYRKKRKFEMGRQPAMTKIGKKKVRVVRSRGGNLKFRGLRLDAGNYTWQSELITFKSKIYDTIYNATSNEFTRTKTLVKNAIVQIDATPFRTWYIQHYGIDLSKKKDEPVTKRSGHVLAKCRGRSKNRVIDDKVSQQMPAGKLLACITSRPGQSGRADGYILEGKELEFYLKKIEKKKS